jgi:predicted SAM-dependent methyltransferase
METGNILGGLRTCAGLQANKIFEGHALMLSTLKSLVSKGVKVPLKTACSNIQHIFDLVDRQVTEKRLIGVQKLHLGCGSRHFKGWANVDFAGPRGTIKWNLTRPIPARPNSIHFIYSEHFIEHITRSEAALLLKNCFDLLVPSGVMRISTPNLKFLVDQYCSGCTKEWRDVQWEPDTPAQMLNEGLHLWGHQFVYDYDELSLALREAGFEHTRAVQWRESEYDELRGRETRPYHGDLIVEAVK